MIITVYMQLHIRDEYPEEDKIEILMIIINEHQRIMIKRTKNRSS